MATFKPATLDDIELINSLAKEIFNPTYSPILSPEQLEYMFEMMYSLPSLREQMTMKGAKYFIVSRDGVECGYISIIKLDVAKYHLDKIYLLPSAQKSGLGREMVNYAVDYVRSISDILPAHLSLNVNRQNIAVGFYKNVGFEVVRAGDFDIGNGYFMNDYIMQIEIK